MTFIRHALPARAKLVGMSFFRVIGASSQTELFDVMAQEECTPSLSQAQRLKAAAQEGKLDRNGMELVMQEEKPQQNKITIQGSKLEKYFPKEYTPKQREDFIIKACEYYSKRLERLKQEREHER